MFFYRLEKPERFDSLTSSYKKLWREKFLARIQKVTLLEHLMTQHLFKDTGILLKVDAMRENTLSGRGNIAVPSQGTLIGGYAHFQMVPK